MWRERIKAFEACIPSAAADGLECDGPGRSRLINAQPKRDGGLSLSGACMLEKWGEFLEHAQVCLRHGWKHVVCCV